MPEASEILDSQELATMIGCKSKAAQCFWLDEHDGPDPRRTGSLISIESGAS